MKQRILKTSVSLIAILSLTLPAFAQVGVGADINASASVNAAGVTVKSSTYASASTSAGRSDTEARGTAMIDQRVEKLNRLLGRVQSTVKLTDSQKASISTTIQTEITNLTNLKAKIASDTSTTSLRADMQSITQAYRIYTLIEPQINIIAAADRVENIVGMMKVIGTKLQARVAADASASANASVTASMTDFNAKVADADVQAKAAISEVSALTPDNGDKTKFQSNLAILKDARSKLHAARQDLVDARKDAQAVVKVLVGNIKSITNIPPSGNVNASSSASTTVH